MLKRILRGLLLGTGIIGGSGVLFLLFLDDVVMPQIVDVARVTVPDIRARSAGEARRFLERIGLRLAVRDSVYSSAPAGEILEQAPGPGAHIKRARRVFVGVSRGPRRYAVPDVTGGSQREARLQILGSQLQVGRTRMESSTALPNGVVLRQHPAAGSRLLRGGRVDLVISSGSPFAPKPVPEVVGMSIETVEDTLAKYEMRLGSIDERVAEHVPPGQILAQQPAGGTRASRHTAVDLVVSIRPVPAPE